MPFPTASSTYKQSIPSSTPIPTRPTSSTNPTTNLTPNCIPIRRNTPTQREERRAQGLCYNCDEKFVPGHKYSIRRFLLLMHGEGCETETEEATIETELPATNEETYFQLSLQAFTGQFSPQTLKFKALLDGLMVTVFVDTGSSHNILQPRIATHLRIPSKPIPNFLVMVGNGSHLHCTGLCPDVPITLQNHLFHIPFYLFPIEGADVVLGMEQLQTLGPLAVDFSIPKISFHHNNIEITLTGDPRLPPSPSTYTQLRHLLTTQFVASIHILTYQPSITSYTPTNTTLSETSTYHHTSISTELQHLLNSYLTIFTEPYGLSPQRPHNHYIPLLPSTSPFKVKPYWYPHSHKEAMTTIIQDILQNGIITPSTSPYSSPVLLVRKKDGSWHFCVDYRALNAVTIRDRFPTPTTRFCIFVFKD